jgi:hypothetical protein
MWLWLAYFGFLELTSLGHTSEIFPCILVSNETQAENDSSYQTCTAMHEAIFRFIRFVWNHATHDNIIAFGTVAIAAFTYTLFRATTKLWNASERQYKLARDEFASIHRPKIRVKHVRLVQDIWQGAPIVINLTCVNTGTAKAKLHQIGVRYDIVRQGAMLPVNPDINAIIQAGGAALECGLNYTWYNIDIGRVVTAPENVEIQNKRSQLFCIGYISYFDAADRMRITGFCRLLDFPSNTTIRADNARFTIYEDPDYEYED